jgi:hypothetical protein
MKTGRVLICDLICTGDDSALSSRLANRHAAMPFTCQRRMWALPFLFQGFVPDLLWAKRLDVVSVAVMLQLWMTRSHRASRQRGNAAVPCSWIIGKVTDTEDCPQAIKPDRYLAVVVPALKRTLDIDMSLKTERRPFIWLEIPPAIPSDNPAINDDLRNKALRASLCKADPARRFWVIERSK